VTRKVTSDLWWKNGLVYCLDIQTYLDTDGDGHGDINGVIERIDYLAGMGVTCLWLMPFQPSAGRDDGYDITDYYAVDPALGTLGDFAEMVRTARDRGIRVIADLVVNHTSDRHPWFQEARRSRDSPFRDFYVWCDERPAEEGEVVFPDAEDSSWEWDEAAGQYYLHRFYREQPDLNVANPAVRDEIAQIAGFWLAQGLSGFRVDAVPFLIEPAGMPEGAVEDPHRLLRDLRAYLGRRNGEAVLLGEVNLPPAEQAPFFGTGDGRELDLVFNFHAMQYMYLALARGEAAPLADALARLEPVPAECGWASFVRNHDELTLDQLSEDERAEVFAAFGPDPDMQLYGRGLRRRLPPMLGGDPDRIRMVYSLAFSLPGIPVLFYGEEIGMGEHPGIEGRLSVRSPMQWSDEANGGFSTADPGDLVRPVVDLPGWDPHAVNAVRQRREDASLLNWFERLIRRRRESPEIGHGSHTVLPCAEPYVFAHRADWAGDTLVAVHNLADTPCRVALPPGDGGDAVELVDLFGTEDLRPGDDGRVHVELGRYGHRWYAVRRRGQRLRV
jgi:maltose alpha-D-glucosyltransferase/alpha-amylase